MNTLMPNVGERSTSACLRKYSSLL
jgi:hypothetical protein